jgi:hypothetical protein
MSASTRNPAWLICLPLAASLLCSPPVAAQAPPTVNPTGCPSADHVTPAHLYGLWSFTLGTPQEPSGQGQIIFTRHPEFPGSVRGTLTLQALLRRHTAMVAGDATLQGFQLEESADGTTIDAVWSGELSADACGHEIRGWRRVLEGNSTQEPVAEQPFLLTQSPGWR